MSKKLSESDVSQPLAALAPAAVLTPRVKLQKNMWNGFDFYF
jgi:hypothetical protein